jgi:hypothetical protein
MQIVERLHAGLSAGVTRHWRYTKEMFDIKPEYLMTIAVADALSEGYDGISELDVQIRLECSTRQIAYQLVSDAAGLKQWFAIKKDVKINRKGRADILATADKASHLVELKGFDPSKAQIEKELVRIQEFFALNAGQNTLRAGHIVFPSLVSCQGRLEKYGRTLLTDLALTCEVVCRKHETDEDPEDGMPVYFTNTLSVSRADA